MDWTDFYYPDPRRPTSPPEGWVARVRHWGIYGSYMTGLDIEIDGRALGIEGSPNRPPAYARVSGGPYYDEIARWIDSRLPGGLKALEETEDDEDRVLMLEDALWLPF